GGELRVVAGRGARPGAVAAGVLLLRSLQDRGGDRSRVGDHKRGWGGRLHLADEGQPVALGGVAERLTDELDARFLRVIPNPGRNPVAVAAGVQADRVEATVKETFTLHVLHERERGCTR